MDLPSPVPSALHHRYPKIDDPKARQLVARALELGPDFFGPPRYPIKEVHVRYGNPLPGNPGLKQGLKLCELVDDQVGEYAIYLMWKPGDAAFSGQMGHECGHLFNPLLRDVYAEGLCTLFAEMLLKDLSIDWTLWEEHFRKGGDAFYAATYWMMKAVREGVNNDEARSLLGFAVPLPDNKMRINIDGWLGWLSEPSREHALQAIATHADAVQREMVIYGDAIHFQVPSALQVSGVPTPPRTRDS